MLLYHVVEAGAEPAARDNAGHNGLGVKVERLTRPCADPLAVSERGCVGEFVGACVLWCVRVCACREDWRVYLRARTHTSPP